jgi:tetratricopeptide (TPR) repeat protein
MIVKFVKKFLGKKSEPKEDKTQKFADSLRQKSQEFSDFLSSKITEGQKEFFSIKHKFKDLRKTNYDVGLLHLEKGNLKDAIFRFRFIKKFWPEFFEAYYQLAYCLVLENKLYDAKYVIQELLVKNPDYDLSHEKKAHDLLSQINSALEKISHDVQENS